MFFKIVNNHNAKIQNDELTEFILDSNIAGIKIEPSSQGGITDPYYYEIQYKRASTHNGFGITSLDHDWSTNLFIPYDKTGKVLSVGFNGSNYGQITYNPVTNDVIGVEVDTINKKMRVYVNNVFHHERAIPFDNLNSFAFSVGSGASTTDYAHIKLLFAENEQFYKSPSGFSSVYVKKKILLKSNNKIYSPISEEILHETKMTSNTAPAPFVASASSVNSTTYPAWKAFDGIKTENDTSSSWNTWASATNQHINSWIQIDYGSIKRINSVELTSRRELNLNQVPHGFKVEGSIDGVNYEILGVFKKTDWKPVTSYRFPLKVGFYRYLKITNTEFASNSDGIASWCNIEYSYTSNLTQLPSDSLDNFINYGSSSIEYFYLINGSKNYILQDTISENTDGLWVQEIDRKPLSIKFEQ